MRWWNVKHPKAYAASLAEGRLPIADSESLDGSARHVEDVMPVAWCGGSTIGWCSPTTAGCWPTPWCATCSTERRA
jgi:hypothetical protein